MDIFESLENLPVSEACFDEIMDMIEQYVVTSPEYSKKYVPGKLYTSQKRADMEEKALNGKAQELADASNREGKSPEDIADRRGYNSDVVAPTEKSSLDSVKAAARRKYGNDANGKRKATKAIKSKFPDFKRPKASDHINIFGKKFKHLTY